MHRPSRRSFLHALGAGTVAGLAGCVGGSTDGTATSASPAGTESPDGTPDRVGLEPVVQGLQAPVAMAFAPDADRRYVLEQSGLVVRHEPDGVTDEPAIDLRDAVTAGGERGLLGIALHPSFEANRRLYLRYSAPPRSGTPSGYSHTFVLAEFRATEDGTRIRRDTERTLLEIPEPQGNHNAGDLAFGPDGHLYVPVGDGGAAGDRGDGHVDDWYDAVGGGNGQDVTDNLLGSLLRIDVDDTAGDRPYSIPEDNPLVGREGLDEHYAWGLRNPWRLSFDGETLLVADVGQNRYEEVNRVERGGNYGWNVKEATHCYGAEDCPDRTPEAVRGGEPLVDPVIEYPNARHREAPVSGVAVVGGHVYRGDAIPDIEGRYVFGDLQVGGRLFVATPRSGGDRWPIWPLPLAEGDAGRLQQLFSFARDADGELYALGAGGRGGGVYRLVAAA